jgi:hypothetical protein
MEGTPGKLGLAATTAAANCTEGPRFRLAAECVRRSEKNHGLAAGMRFAQCLLPPLAAANILDIEEHVLVLPTIRSEPLFEGDGGDIVLARMTDEQTRQDALTEIKRYWSKYIGDCSPSEIEFEASWITSSRQNLLHQSTGALAAALAVEPHAFGCGRPIRL